MSANASASAIVPVSSSVALKAEVEELKNIITHLVEKITTMESMQDVQTKNLFLMYQLLEGHINRRPQPLQEYRGQILMALIEDNGGKLLERDARRRMSLSRSVFSELLTSMRDQIEVTPYSGNQSWNLLILKTSVSPNTEHTRSQNNG